ncbi:MBL fold metallo-hydrolase [uncultured Desulfuromusa sp.]|uniref:MBL fold metallo-hydrolase n=1 Tax=uncultured Desulfuromusa sp. TaxID=219183 RepID=UPI002AA8A07D|nr:MBL fold metallo-hydrolase [uncultured Desulfuromusa sp.]
MTKPATTLRCIGSGDAFGSGGRLNSCYHLNLLSTQMLLDCGCSSLIGLQRWGVHAAEIDTVVISHLHGDHFGGIPYLLLEGKYASQRSKALTLVGPPGLQQRVEAVSEAFYPGIISKNNNFPVVFQLLDPQKPLVVNDARIECFRVRHGKSKHAYGLRIEVDGKVISYSGDTEWTENLIPLSQGSDLFIVECCAYDQPIPSHLDYRTLQKHRSKLECRKLVLTHMGPEMLSRLDDLELDTLNDGDVFEI